jgi:hypothetical protein
MANVTEPQSISAIEAPRSMAAAAATGDIPGAGRPGAVGEGETTVRRARRVRGSSASTTRCSRRRRRSPSWFSG